MANFVTLFRYMKSHIFALRWKDEIRRSSQLRTLLKLVVVDFRPNCTPLSSITIINKIERTGFEKLVSVAAEASLC